MGIGPLVAWRRTSLRALGDEPDRAGGRSRSPAESLLLALGAGSSLPGLVAYTFCAFVLAAIALEFIRGTRARQGARPRPSWPAAFSSLVGRNRRRYGGYIVHAAIVLLALGIAGGAYGSTKVQKLEPGQTMKIRGYDLRYLGSVARNEPNRTEIRARLAVSRGRPEPRHVPGRQEQLPGGGAGLERGRDPHRLAARAGPVPDRRPVQRRRLGVAEGARQPARRPDLARGLRLPARLADRDVAGRARAAPAGAPHGAPVPVTP